MVIYQRRLRFRGNGCYCKILPVYDEETGTLTPFRENGQLGDWLRVYPAVRLSTGVQVVRFIPYVHGNNISMLSNPIVRLQQAIADAQRRKILIPSWENVFPKSFQSGVDPVIVFDRISYFVLAVVFQLTEEEVFNPPLFPCLLQLPKSAGESLRNIKHDILQPNNMLVKFTPRQAQSVVQNGVNTIIPSHYQVDVVPIESIGYNGDLDSYIEAVKNTQLSWNKLIQIPPIEEQIQLLAYSLVPKSLMAYTFGREFLHVPNPQYWEDAHRQLEQELAISSHSAPNVKAVSPVQPYTREIHSEPSFSPFPSNPVGYVDPKSFNPNMTSNPYGNYQVQPPPGVFPSGVPQNPGIPKNSSFVTPQPTPVVNNIPNNNQMPFRSGEIGMNTEQMLSNQPTPNPQFLNIPGVVPDDSLEDLNPIVSVPAKKVLERLHQNRAMKDSNPEG